MSVYRTQEKAWLDAFEQEWSSVQYWSPPDEATKARADEIKDAYRRNGWHSYMLPSEAAYRGMVKLCDEIAESRPLSEEQKLRLRRALHSARPRGLPMPPQWEAVRDVQQEEMDKRVPSLRNDPAVYILGELIYPWGPLLLAVQIAAFWKGEVWQGFTMLDAARRLGVEISTLSDVGSALARMPASVALLLTEIVAALAFGIFIFKKRKTEPYP